MNVFVLACGRFGRCLEKAGDKTRLNLTFGGMTLLERVIRMTRQHGHEPIVAIDEDVVEESIQHLGAETFRAPRGRSCVHSILDTRSLWDGHNVFLMGDVVYTRMAYGLSFRDHKGVCKVIGNHLEPFALSFGKTDEARVVKTLEETVAMMGLPA
ncbi:MAG: hypothetical protein KAJ19_19815, partial [Gammaproteobacteria bacterium]|nr:hypothetical protein [Gammaproteobacteria bacterium]